MFSTFERRLRQLIQSGAAPLLRDGLMGLEKEGLRIGPNGRISSTPHPIRLGSALTHPEITTDYSEALLELITPPFRDAGSTLEHLRELHRFVYSRLDDEVIWGASMPCIHDGDSEVPIAWYGESNRGRMKHIYRVGLGYRYGRAMQAIAGVHCNYSVADAFWSIWQELEGNRYPLRQFRDDGYFGLIRNLQRFGWLILYLFGSSPAVCRGFVATPENGLQSFDPDTYYDPCATSLRMGDIGYTNRQEKGVGVVALYDDLETYIASLRDAIETPCPRWREIGVRVDGEYRQLNANLLQIENEYYSTVRPKQPPNQLEKPIDALRARGVAYVELRSLDVNPFEPLGVGLDQLRFIEMFMLFGLLQESPTVGGRERQEIDDNLIETAHRGRGAGFRLHRSGEEVTLSQWALEILDAMQAVAELLDGDHSDRPYTTLLEVQRESVFDPDRTPSARLLREMRERRESYFDAVWRLSRGHKETILRRPFPGATEALLERIARESIEAQLAIEAEPQPPFDQFLADYFAPRSA